MNTVETLGWKLTDIFKDVLFFDEDHSYMYKGNEYKSVTTVIKEFQQPFRSDYWLTFKAVQKKGYKVTGDYKDHVPEDHLLIHTKTKGDKLFHYSKVPTHYAPKKYIKELKEEWRIKGENGRNQGTYIHDYMENLYRGKVYKRDAFLESLKNDDWCPIALEKVIADHDYQIAGQVDAAFFDVSTTEIILVDFKTDQKIEKTNFFNKMKYPLDLLDDCNFSKYTIQLNMYRYIIEKHTKVRIDRMYIQWIDYDNKKSELIEVPRYEINKLLYVYYSTRNKRVA